MQIFVILIPINRRNRQRGAAQKETMDHFEPCFDGSKTVFKVALIGEFLRQEKVFL